MRWIAALVVLFALATTTDAHARDRQQMTFGFASTVAINYWAKRGVAVPCEPKRKLLNRKEAKALATTWGYTVDMVAYVKECAIGVTPVAEFYRTDHELNWVYCQEVVHEIGHLAGLHVNGQHPHNGSIMDQNTDILPWGCDHPRRFRRLMSVTRNASGRR